MRRTLAVLFAAALVSCSSSASKPGPAPANAASGVESLCPAMKGGTALGGGVEVVDVRRDDARGGTHVVLKAGRGMKAYFAARWFSDGKLAREFRTEDGWTEVMLEAGKEKRLWIPAPYPFAPVLGLDVAAKKPAGLAGEGKALPGRIVVTPEQAAKLAFYQYPDLELSIVQSRKHAKAPKLAVWRDGKGKVVAALEIHVKEGAKADAGISFLHTNGKRQMGTSLAYANTSKGAPSGDGWEFMIFRQGDGREVAVPWKPLVRNASFLGVCAGGAAGLDAALLGDTAQIGTFLEDGTSDLETAPLRAPSWSMANPTGGSLSSGAPVTCEYSGARSQLWTVSLQDDMTFTPAAGGGAAKTCSGTLPAGTGAVDLGTLRAVRPGLHQFFYSAQDLEEDPACEDRLLASDGPVCPGEASSAPAEILTEAGHGCTAEVPGSASTPAGAFEKLTIPCSAAGGTALIAVNQKDEEPGFVAVACDGEEMDEDLEFTAVPTETIPMGHVYIQIDNGGGVIKDEGGPEVFGEVVDDTCDCKHCRLIVIYGQPRRGIGDRNWTATRDELDEIAEVSFGRLSHRRLDNTPAMSARRQHMLAGPEPFYDPHGTWTLDVPIFVAQNFAREMASAHPDARYHVMLVPGADGFEDPCTVLKLGRNNRRTDDRTMRLHRPGTGDSLVRHFAHCHRWEEVLFIYHGSATAFTSVVDAFIAMVRTPVKRIVFWSCWGADRIDKDGDDFDRLKAHLLSSKCNCPPRGAPPADDTDTPAAHPASTACSACPLDPEHCPYEGTVIITAATIPVDARVRDTDPPRLIDVSTPLSIDFRGGQWVLTSADGRVRKITISKEGRVTEETVRGDTAIEGVPVGTDDSLRRRAILRNMRRLAEGLGNEAAQRMANRILPKFEQR
ncbi:MAG: hypothetical protein AAB074_02425 [Planctomycetota bacterium]